MELKYRVKGRVNSPFILRGLHFAVGSDMDFCICEKELEFVKERINVSQLIDLKRPIETPNPVLEKSKTESVEKPKGVKASGKKQTSGTSQRANSNNI